MKQIKTYIKKWYFIRLFFFLFAITALTQCVQESFEYDAHTPSGELGITAWQFIQQQDSLSMLEEAITATGLESLYSGTTEYTFILPRNNAFIGYLTTNSYSSISDIPVPVLRNILLYHIAEGKVLFTDEVFYTGEAIVVSQTENGQDMYLSRNDSYIGTINTGTNKSWSIETSNLEPTNGAIHILADIAYYSAITGSTSVPDPSLDRDTIYVTEDAAVRAGTSADVNQGAADDLTLRVDINGSINDRKVFLKFDLSQVTTHGNLREAYLNLGAYYAAGKGMDIYLKNVQDITWSENTITWNTMPLPDTEIFSSILSPSTALAYLTFSDEFTWDCTDYIASKLASPGEITIMMDAPLGSNDGIMFVSKENATYSYPARIITVYSGGTSTLAMGTNTGLTVASGGTVVLDTDQLSMDGPDPSDIVYTIESAPLNGWLVAGLKVLSAGDKFTQQDIDANNIVYISSGSDDSFTVSVVDRDGGIIAPFDVVITVVN